MQQYLTKPIPIETSQSFQLSLTVEVNLPRNSMIKTYQNRSSNVAQHINKKDSKKLKALNI